MRVSVFVRVCLCLSVHEYMCVFACMCLWLCVYVCVDVCGYLSVSVCV